MKKELEERLYKHYPELFSQRHLPMSQTCMCWGICCGDGWFKIIQKLCSTIMWYCGKVGRPPPIFTQVKEKFGTLRVYVDREDTVIEALVERAERESAHTCEECGDWGTLNKLGWIKCACETHTKPANKKYDEQFEKYQYYFFNSPWFCNGPIMFFARWGWKINRVYKKIWRWWNP